MQPPKRPVESLDVLPKRVAIHSGFVFSGHLDVPRLQEAAAKVVEVYPELNVSIKGDWFTLGEWHTPASKGPAWDFKHRELPDKTLADAFAPAAAAVQMDLGASSKVTSLGIADISDAQGLFGFDGPSIGSLGLSPIPTLSFRVTTLGTPDDGHTLLAMIIPHFITDAMGLGGLMETWGRLYRGEDVPTRTENPHPDLLKILDATPAVDSTSPIKENEQPGSGLRAGFLDFFSYARDMSRLASSKEFEERYVHFPGRLLEKYRDEARARLGSDIPGPFVSRHDIFTAMMLKLYANSSFVSDKTQPFDFYNVYSVSSVFPKGSLPTPYLHNINTPGWFPFPSSSEILSTSLPELATIIRKRLNALRTVDNVREVLLYNERMASALGQVPRVDARHGWGMVSSWGGVEDVASVGFADEKLVFLRPATQNLGEMAAPNIAYSFRDGHGGIISRIVLIKGDWDAMWAGSGLDGLEV